MSALEGGKGIARAGGGHRPVSSRSERGLIKNPSQKETPLLLNGERHRKAGGKKTSSSIASRKKKTDPDGKPRRKRAEDIPCSRRESFLPRRYVFSLKQ